MPLVTYTLEQAEIWDTVVRSFAAYDVYYLSGYVKAFWLHGDGEPMLFYYEGEGLRGIHVVMKRDIADDAIPVGTAEGDTLFDFITPYGYGGWLLEGEGDRAPLFAAYEDWCRRHRIVSEFVRYHPLLNNAEATASFYDVVPLGHTVAMELDSPEVIWENLTSKNRNMIRKGIKSGVKVYHGRFPAIYRTFREIYNQTMDADHARAYYYFSESFYESLLYDLKNEAQVFWAEWEGRIIAASLMIEANGFMNYHLSGSLGEYRSFAPTNLLLYEAALWGCRNGYKTLHLGGGVGSREDSLYKFKSAFNRQEPRRFFIGKKIHLSDAYERLVQMKGTGADDGFFPQYRA
jgi:hypothetical protein